MDASRFARLSGRAVLSAAFVLGSALLAAGCDNADAKAGERKSEAAVGEAPAQAQPAATKVAAEAKSAGQAAYLEDAFKLTLEAPTEVKAGAPASLKIVLVAQNGYKVNEEYPTKFKFTPSPGVKSAKDTVRADDAKVDKKSIEMPAVVTVAKPGKATVSGRLSFSVCTEERCLIEKRDLKITLNAS